VVSQGDQKGCAVAMGRPALGTRSSHDGHIFLV
jgi:hypothetical protein